MEVTVLEACQGTEAGRWRELGGIALELDFENGEREIERELDEQQRKSGSREDFHFVCMEVFQPTGRFAPKGVQSFFSL
jgi:hypothetical protein